MESIQHVELMKGWPQPSSVGEASINACQRPFLISYVTHDDKLAVIEVHLCHHLIYGHPNDESLQGHPLFGSGLEYYTAHRVNNSKLIAQLEARNSSHPRHDKAEFLSGKEHYIITFQDATLEFVATSSSYFPLKVHVFDSAAQAVVALGRNVV
jgi:hypothetical protein